MITVVAKEMDGMISALGRGLPLAVGLCACVASYPADGMDKAFMARTIQAYVDLPPGDDIANGYRASHARAVDLDGDGREEILYLLSADCVGASFDCPNDLTVLTSIKKDAEWPAHLRLVDDVAAARRTGYEEADSVHIPGEVERIWLDGRHIHVAFAVMRDSPICRRFTHNGMGVVTPTAHCPEPGRYQWVYAWAHGKLTRER